MLCCICKEREATVHYTKIDGDKVQKVDLCEECSKTKGVNDPVGFELADLLLGLGSKEIEQSSGGVEIKCSRCGFTQASGSNRPGMPCVRQSASHHSALFRAAASARRCRAFAREVIPAFG